MIGLIYTKSFGEVIGEITEHFEGERVTAYTVENPERIHYTPNGVALIAMCDLITDSSITFDANELAISGIKTPITEVVNTYKEKYGKVITETKPNKIQLLT